MEIIEYSLVYTNFPKKHVWIYLWVNDKQCYMWGFIPETPYGVEPNAASAIKFMQKHLKDAILTEKVWHQCYVICKAKHVYEEPDI